jgi:hypothetical protein
LRISRENRATDQLTAGEKQNAMPRSSSPARTSGGWANDVEKVRCVKAASTDEMVAGAFIILGILLNQMGGHRGS